MRYTGSCNFEPLQQIMLRTYDAKMLIDLDISAKVKGKITYCVTDSDMLSKSMGFDITSAPSRTEFEAKLCDTVLNALQPEAAKLSIEGISPDALKAKDFGLAENVMNALTNTFISEFGVDITSFELTDISYDENDINMLDSCIYRFNSMAETNAMLNQMKAGNTMADKEKALDDVLAQTQDILKFYSKKF